MENRHKDAAAKLMQLLHAGIEKGEFRPSVPIEELSKMLISTLEGLNVSCLFLEEETIDIEGQIGTLQKLLEMALNVKDQ